MASCGAGVNEWRRHIVSDVGIVKMEDFQNLECLLEEVRGKYKLDQFRVPRALIFAPFGQGYFDDALHHLDLSRAVSFLAKKKLIKVILVTSLLTDVSRCPSWAKIIKIDEIPHWPNHDRYQSRFIKWGIPFLFPGIGASIYLDANLLITNSSERIINLFADTEQSQFLLTAHTARKGWSDEYKAILEGRFMDGRRLNEQISFFEQIGLPQDLPVSQTNFLGRVHKSKSTILNLYVLSQLLQYSERDQLAFIYAMFKTGLSPKLSPEGSYLFRDSKELNIDTICFIPRVFQATYAKRFTSVFCKTFAEDMKRGFMSNNVRQWLRRIRLLKKLAAKQTFSLSD